MNVTDGAFKLQSCQCKWSHFELLELKQYCEQKTLFDSINVIRPEQCHTVSAHTSRILYSNDRYNVFLGVQRCRGRQMDGRIHNLTHRPQFSNVLCRLWKGSKIKYLLDYQYGKL